MGRSNCRKAPLAATLHVWQYGSLLHAPCTCVSYSLGPAPVWGVGVGLGAEKGVRERRGSYQAIAIRRFR